MNFAVSIYKSSSWISHILSGVAAIITKIIFHNYHVLQALRAKAPPEVISAYLMIQASKAINMLKR